VNALVLLPIANSVSASAGSCLPTSRCPLANVATTSPPLTTATATPGTSNIARVSSSHAGRPSNIARAWAAACAACCSENVSFWPAWVNEPAMVLPSALSVPRNVGSPGTSAIAKATSLPRTTTSRSGRSSACWAGMSIVPLHVPPVSASVTTTSSLPPGTAMWPDHLPATACAATEQSRSRQTVSRCVRRCMAAVR
jgi:hypothetical protein